MVLSNEANNLIASYVNQRKRLSDLNSQEYRHLVAEHIRHLSKYEKGAVLADADQKTILPDLVADLIESNSFTAMKRLISGILSVFVFGFNNSKPFFNLDFEEKFDEEWAAQHPEFDEHFEHDCRQRARELNLLEAHNGFAR